MQTKELLCGFVHHNFGKVDGQKIANHQQKRRSKFNSFLISINHLFKYHILEILTQQWYRLRETYLIFLTNRSIHIQKDIHTN
jgi:hypothetical protein